MYRFWFIIIDWLLDVYCLLMGLIDEFVEHGITACGFILVVIGYCMSIFKKVLAWPWKKIITVVVKVGTWLLDKLPADQPKAPKL